MVHSWHQWTCHSRPSSIWEKLEVIMMNCAVCLKKPLHTHSIAPKRQQITRDLAHLNPEKLPPICSTADLRKEFLDCFEGIGKFPGKYHIIVKPVIHAPQKCPITMRSHVCAKPDCLECLGIIWKVDEPTDWVSSFTFAWKPNGKLHVCLDPRDLNSTIKCDHHRTPSMEEITHNFTGSTIFTKVDGIACYYCIKLYEESQLLTPFNSLEGCYCFQHPPQGLVCTQDIFQKKIDHIMEQCTGVIGITDDFCIHGNGPVEHDAWLHHFMSHLLKWPCAEHWQVLHCQTADNLLL